MDNCCSTTAVVDVTTETDRESVFLMNSEYKRKKNSAMRIITMMLRVAEPMITGSNEVVASVRKCFIISPILAISVGHML